LVRDDKVVRVSLSSGGGNTAIGNPNRSSNPFSSIYARRKRILINYN
jgi:hypothetical protein